MEINSFKKHKALCFILLVFLLIILNKNSQATTCELNINDEGIYNGFVEKENQLYYVVTISEKSINGNLSSIKFRVNYDQNYLELPTIKNTTLDLGEKGIFENKPYILNRVGTYDSFALGSNCYLAKNEIGRDLVAIEESEVDLLKLCFKVKDNTTEKRLVYIDTKDESTQILYAYPSPTKRFITNGVVIKEDIINPPDKDDLDFIVGEPPSGGSYTGETIANNGTQISSKGNSKIWSPNKLPKTGVKKTFFITLLILLISSIVLLIRFKRIKKIIKK